MLVKRVGSRMTLNVEVDWLIFFCFREVAGSSIGLGTGYDDTFS